MFDSNPSWLLDPKVRHQLRVGPLNQRDNINNSVMRLLFFYPYRVNGDDASSNQDWRTVCPAVRHLAKQTIIEETFHTSSLLYQVETDERNSELTSKIYS